MEAEAHVSTSNREAPESVLQLYCSIRDRFLVAVTNFESRWTAWQATFPTEAACTESLDACVHSDEFQALERLGPKIIPFVVYKLAIEPDQNSYAVLLYNTLETDSAYRVGLEGPPHSKEVLRDCGKRIVELNRQRNEKVEIQVAAWTQYHWDNQLQSSSEIFTSCEEYWSLLEWGPSIIARAMVEFYDHPDAYWWELLHEIIHGRKMGAYEYQKPVLFEACCCFFNEGEHREAPKYEPTQWDVYMKTGVMGDEVWEHFRRSAP